MLRLFVAFVLFLSAIAATSARADETCRHFIEGARDQVTSVIHATDKSFMQKHEALISLFEKTVDINWLAQKSAGEYWQQASEQQRAAYLNIYRVYLTDYYVGTFDENDINSILDVTLTKFKQAEGNAYQARLQITQKDDEPIDAYLHLVEEPAGVCHIHDFTIEGVSVVSSQSEEIQSLGKSGGLAFITEKLAARKQTR